MQNNIINYKPNTTQSACTKMTTINTTRTTRATMRTIDDLISELLTLDDLEKTQLFHQHQTGRLLIIDEILMTFTNEQILDISEKFDEKIFSEFPVFPVEIAQQKNIVIQEWNTTEQWDEFINIQDELKLLETENTFILSNSTDMKDDMPETKKSKN